MSYDAAVRALDFQERGAEQPRARTGTLLAASSLTASFLGAQTIQRSNGLALLRPRLGAFAGRAKIDPTRTGSRTERRHGARRPRAHRH